MKANLLVLLLLLFLGIGVASATGTDPIPVSIINLIATPERYEGLRVRVVGFAASAEERTIYLSDDDALAANKKNALSLTLVSPLPNLRMKHVVVEGTFRSSYGDFAGSIDSITRFERWTAPEDTAGEPPQTSP